jgi:hypothetical protein
VKRFPLAGLRKGWGRRLIFHPNLNTGKGRRKRRGVVVVEMR